MAKTALAFNSEANFEHHAQDSGKLYKKLDLQKNNLCNSLKMEAKL